MNLRKNMNKTLTPYTTNLQNVLGLVPLVGPLFGQLQHLRNAERGEKIIMFKFYIFFK